MRALHLDVDVAGAAGLETGDDRPQPVAPARVGELVAAEAITVVVVLAVRVRLPEVEQRAADRAAWVSTTSPVSSNGTPVTAAVTRFDRRGVFGV